MTLPLESSLHGLAAYREYLRLLAQLQLPVDIQMKLDASDIAQETLLRAHERRDQFNGCTAKELAAWLRSILANQLTDAVRRYRSEKRDASLEMSLHQELKNSSARLEQLLVAPSRTPSERCIRDEDLLKLSAALARLPGDQRCAVEWKHLRGRSIADIAQHLSRSKAAVGGLLRRGMQALREALTEST